MYMFKYRTSDAPQRGYNTPYNTPSPESPFSRKSHLNITKVRIAEIVDFALQITDQSLGAQLRVWLLSSCYYAGYLLLIDFDVSRSSYQKQ